MSERKNVRINFFITPEQYDKLGELAKQSNTSASEVIRTLIDNAPSTVKKAVVTEADRPF